MRHCIKLFSSYFSWTLPAYKSEKTSSSAAPSFSLTPSSPRSPRSRVRSRASALDEVSSPKARKGSMKLRPVGSFKGPVGSFKGSIHGASFHSRRESSVESHGPTPGSFLKRRSLMMGSFLGSFVDHRTEEKKVSVTDPSYRRGSACVLAPLAGVYLLPASMLNSCFALAWCVVFLLCLGLPGLTFFLATFMH